MTSEAPKVVVHLRATGDAPILKQAKFKSGWSSCVVGRDADVPVLFPLYDETGHVLREGDYVIVSASWRPGFRIAGTDKFVKVIDFLRRQLHRETLFVYINSAFSPNPDELVKDLYNNFGFDGKLVVNYACSMAWG